MAIRESEAFLAADEDVQIELVDLFANLQHEIAAELGIEPQPGPVAWTDEQAERIMAEVERRFLPMLLEARAEDDGVIAEASSTTA